MQRRSFKSEYRRVKSRHASNEMSSRRLQMNLGRDERKLRCCKSELRRNESERRTNKSWRRSNKSEGACCESIHAHSNPSLHSILISISPGALAIATCSL